MVVLTPLTSHIHTPPPTLYHDIFKILLIYVNDSEWLPCKASPSNSNTEAKKGSGIVAQKPAHFVDG